MADDDLLGLVTRAVPTQVPAATWAPATTCATTAQWQVRLHQLAEEVDVAYGQAQRVYLGEALFVGQRGDVRTQPLEGVVYGLHAAPLAHIGCLSQLLQLRLGAHTSPSPCCGRCSRPVQTTEPRPRGQYRGARVGKARGWRAWRVGEAAYGGPCLTTVAAAVLGLAGVPQRRRSERMRGGRGRGLQQQARTVAVAVFVQLVTEELHLRLLIPQQFVAVLQWVPRGLIGEEVFLIEVSRRECVQAPGKVLQQHGVHDGRRRGPGRLLGCSG